MAKKININRHKVYKSKELNEMLWYLQEEGISWVIDNVDLEYLANIITGPDGMDSELMVKLGGLIAHLEEAQRFNQIIQSIPFDADYYEEDRD